MCGALRMWQVVSREQVAKGFRRLLAAAADLQLDVPGAPEQIAIFIARAVVDAALPPAFVEDVPTAGARTCRAHMPPTCRPCMPPAVCVLDHASGRWTPGSWSLTCRMLRYTSQKVTTPAQSALDARACSRTATVCVPA
jgi:hypothetical protein